MNELFSRLNPGEVIAFLSISGGMLIGLVSIILGIWHRIRAEEIAAELKRDMLDRGLSAEEIKTILEAGPKKL